jgi:hypothetical protein
MVRNMMEETAQATITAAAIRLVNQDVSKLFILNLCLHREIVAVY